MKKHTKKELKDMINLYYGASHTGEKIIDIYSFILEDREVVRVMFLAPDTHVVYKETYAYHFNTNNLLFIKVNGIL